MFGIAVEIWIIAGLMVLAIMLLMSALARLYRKAGPHEALVVYGFGGTRVVKGHGTIVLPMVQVCRGLSLELMSFDVAPQQDLYTKQGVAVTVEAVAQIKVKSDMESILTASEQFLTKTDQEREGLIRLVMEGHLRGIIGQLTVEEIVKQPEMVADRMRSTCADDMNKMGLEVISFTIKEVRDKNEYITNMGKPDVARIKRDADVATAEADRDTAIKRALAQREDRSTVRARGSGEDPGAIERQVFSHLLVAPGPLFLRRDRSFFGRLRRRLFLRREHLHDRAALDPFRHFADVGHHLLGLFLDGGELLDHFRQLVHHRRQAALFGGDLRDLAFGRGGDQALGVRRAAVELDIDHTGDALELQARLGIGLDRGFLA